MTEGPAGTPGDRLPALMRSARVPVETPQHRDENGIAHGEPLGTEPPAGMTIVLLYCTVQRMAQINLHVTPEFEDALETLMRARGLRSKSEAIRHAVREAAAQYRVAPARDFSVLQGLLRRHASGKGGPRRPVAELEREIDSEMERSLGARAATRRKRAR